MKHSSLRCILVSNINVSKILWPVVRYEKPFSVVEHNFVLNQMFLRLPIFFQLSIEVNMSRACDI